MEFNDLLRHENIDPKGVLVLRHRPKERGLRKVMPWLAAEHPDVYNAYQQTQGPRAEKAVGRAQHVASFIGHEPGRAVYVGLYRKTGSEPLTFEQLCQVPAIRVLTQFGLQQSRDERDSVEWFYLDLMDFYSEWKGRLIVNWPGLERSWYRWADRNVIPIRAIHEDSILDRQMPHWRELCLSWSELDVLPTKWKSALSQWRGIYFIFDTSDEKGYVGSAYGNENLLGRWLNYSATGHGGNSQLRTRDPKHFHFSILQRVSPDMEPEDVIALESSWKDRLHTREFGLNDN